MPAGSSPDRIVAVRRFNRAYTRHLGVLRRNYLGSDYTLGEARILYEIGHGGAQTATDVGRALDLDHGYLSRILRTFAKKGLITRAVSAADGRQIRLALSGRGARALVPLDRSSQRLVGQMLADLTEPEQSRLVAAMTTIEDLLWGDAGGRAEQSKQAGQYTLRAPRPGDFGWIVKRHAELYASEYRWKAPFEGVCAQIVADFVNNYDSRRERGWIAEQHGENVGTVMLVRDSADTARIRLLLVEPRARGLGIGARLTDECIRFARRRGYRKITLWTHSVLTAARHIYQNAGFKLVRSERHRNWGPPVVSEHWDLQL